MRKRKVYDLAFELNCSAVCGRIDEDHDMIMLGGVQHDQHSRQMSPTTERMQDLDSTAIDTLGFEDIIMFESGYSSQESAKFSTFSEDLDASRSTSLSSDSLLDVSTTPQEGVKNHKDIVEDMTKLVDSSFRTMIYGEKSQTAQGIRCTQCSKGPKLAEIAAPLFSPGYLPVSHSLPCKRDSNLVVNYLNT